MIIELNNKKDYALFGLYHFAQGLLAIVVFLSIAIAQHKLIIVPKAKVQAVRALVER